MFDQLHESLIKSLTESKITKPTEIQTQAIPIILENKNVIGLSETGSGKTLAYLLPTIQKTIGKPKKNISVLIVTPTKELCAQVLKEVKKLTRHNQLLSTIIIGGENAIEQVRTLNKGQHIVVAGPGRLVDHIIKENIDLSAVDTVILDEVDIMMDMGFYPQLEIILTNIPESAQKLMFSATLNEDATKLVQTFVTDFEKIEINANQAKSSIEEIFTPIKKELRVPFLKFLIKTEKIRSALIFSNTKDGARFLFEQLNASKYKVALLEGEMSTHQRKISLDKFKRKEVQFLIATDVASRGIDIPHVTHVINFEVPLNLDSYIHRIGRTARHEKDGKAFTFCDLENDEKNILRIKDEISVKKYKEFDYNLKLKKK